ncbi:MAG: 4'-phosphopantetheinyl transferase superfamily protein [Candidatus Bipolaricaulota bacterium]|nr:4'-phosphopantetheinyl transferase superfamily protein [Candidatus Bipolaricaulota bacterium]
MRALLVRWGPERLGRLFTERELRYALASPRLAPQRLAARFAAKEAFRKALGRAVPFRELEVVLEGARPCLRWQGRTYPVSLSHTPAYAVAVAAVTPPPPPPGPSAAPEG